MFGTDNLYDVSEIALIETEHIFMRYPAAVILSQNAIDTGTVGTVYDVKGTRHYRATEFTHDTDESVSPEYGYDTTEKYHYMGERYKGQGLFGIYECEVFAGICEQEDGNMHGGPVCWRKDVASYMCTAHYRDYQEWRRYANEPEDACRYC